MLQISYGKPEELLLTLEDTNGRTRTAKINERDVENEEMSSRNEYETYYDYAQTCEYLTKTMEWDKSVYVIIFGARIALIEFAGILY